MRPWIVLGWLMWASRVGAWADLPTGADGGTNLVANPGFEAGAAFWRSWSRATGAIVTEVETTEVRSGSAAMRLEHRANEDWSFEPSMRVEVATGDVVEMEAWVRVSGEGTVTVCASTWDSSGKVIDWAAGSRTATRQDGWQRLRTRWVAGERVAVLQPRLIGYGPAKIDVDDVSVVRRGSLRSFGDAGLPAEVRLTNAVMELRLRTADATVVIESRGGGRRWVQRPMEADLIVRRVVEGEGALRCRMMQVSSGLEFDVELRLEADRPEATVALRGGDEMLGDLAYPHPFVGSAGDYLVVPMNEGISYPVDDASVPPMRLIAYGGHGLCMAFYGVTDGEAGQMTFLETPDDASVRIDRLESRLAIAPLWNAQRGRFGYERKLRWIFFEHGGHVAMAKWYRGEMARTGRLRTLAEKRRTVPDVDRLVGAVNVWCWDRDAVSLARELQAAGIERILWSNRQSPENLRALNEMGVLTSRYDIYQDAMAPTNLARVQWVHPDWTTNAWPRDLIIDRNGRWVRGWGVESREGGLIPCGVLCDRQALPYARERVPTELATHPYRCRFIDTTTASPWNECYHPDHPMTRSESRHWKMELLRYMSEERGLVTGSETGHDAAVPYVHYFEGMLSLGPYRVPDAGRKMMEEWTEVPEPVAKYQVGQGYRLPLWELVYHDCVVAQWYWGDYNNKLPPLWDRRDLFNVLYGVPPMFMFDRARWEARRERFVRSYRDTCPHVRRVGYEAMIDHRFLSRDRAVQQTVFANGVRITVNFGATPYVSATGAPVASMGYVVEGP